MDTGTRYTYEPTPLYSLCDVAWHAQVWDNETGRCVAVTKLFPSREEAVASAVQMMAERKGESDL